MNESKDRIVEKLILYKTTSNLDPEHIVTKKSGLTGAEIDNNMLFLYGKQIAGLDFNEDQTKAILTRIDGSAIEVELPKIGDSEFSLDKGTGNLIIKNPSGEEVTVEGFFTESTLNIVNEHPLKGNGTKKDPLRIDRTYISGNLGYVEDTFIEKDDMVFEPEDTTDEIRKKLGTKFNRIIVKRTVYPCVGTKEISGTEYVLLDGDEARPMHNGDSFTLVGIGGVSSAKYMLENAGPIEVVNKIDPKDGILSIGQFGLKTDLAIERGDLDGVYSIFLKGKDGHVLSSISAGDFVMDSFLEEVNIHKEEETHKTYLVFKFRVIDDDQNVEYKEIKVDIDALMADIIQGLEGQITTLQNSMDELKKELNDKIALLNTAIDCIDKSAIKEITGTGNEISVAYENNKEGNNKTAKIGFAEDTYFIAGE